MRFWWVAQSCKKRLGFFHNQLSICEEEDNGPEKPEPVHQAPKRNGKEAKSSGKNGQTPEQKKAERRTRPGPAIGPHGSTIGRSNPGKMNIKRLSSSQGMEGQRCTCPVPVYYT